MTNDPQLYIVPTPIGNMEDITLRAIETLKNSDIILAEDTRHAKKLLKHYNILTKVNSYHLNNEHKRVDEYLQMLVNGSTVSLITDAGTPLFKFVEIPVLFINLRVSLVLNSP